MSPSCLPSGRKMLIPNAFIHSASIFLVSVLCQKCPVLANHIEKLVIGEINWSSSELFSSGSAGASPGVLALPWPRTMTL